MDYEVVGPEGICGEWHVPKELTHGCSWASQRSPLRRSLLTMDTSANGPSPNVLTIDVEDYIHVSAFRRLVPYADWGRMESRVERNTHAVLELLEEFRLHGTFFVLGWVAERYPSLVQAIQAAGHELGCHSYAHRLVYELTPDEFRADTQRGLCAIEDAAGAPVRAYRAPSFSITARSLWALEILLELGFTIDRASFPPGTGFMAFPMHLASRFEFASTEAT
jgi:polysaccharide deacetylase family protein (PEP-CTERM system associated)